jgi:hypothetical protein
MTRRSRPAADRAYHDNLYRTRFVIERFFNRIDHFLLSPYSLPQAR